ncbi:MAG: hypothetical protein LBT80_05120 [Lactobacillaceae bacterium]|jgi:hypothetical protein|nr:hypothetical protein [Lactobacillaceae bacterium]
MKKELVLAAAVVAALGTTPMGLVAADTYTFSDGSGTWSGDGATEVSTTIASTYEVTIPETLTLPQTATFTEEEDNVTVTSGAQIPADQSILVKLTGGGAGDQTFTAEYEGATDDDINYLVKLNSDAPIANTSSDATNQVIKVTASQAHDSGATGAINVGFSDTPDFKYSGKYSQNVAFTVSVVDTDG